MAGGLLLVLAVGVQQGLPPRASAGALVVPFWMGDTLGLTVSLALDAQTPTLRWFVAGLRSLDRILVFGGAAAAAVPLFVGLVWCDSTDPAAVDTPFWNVTAAVLLSGLHVYGLTAVRLYAQVWSANRDRRRRLR